MSDYEQISGLTAYFVHDITEVNDAKEKNIFCKCLKMSAKACELCEKSEKENYTSALKNKKVQSFACHAGIVKWSVPVDIKGLTGVIVSEGVITKAQRDEKESWVARLAEDYNISKANLNKYYDRVQVMDEDQAQLSIEILQSILRLYAARVDE